MKNLSAFTLPVLIAGLCLLPVGRATAQTLQTIFAFAGTNGADPHKLTLGPGANFYGTTDEGGSGGNGTIFQVTPNGILTTLVSFNSTNIAYYPPPVLTFGNDGNFYGTTIQGGITNSLYPYGFGTVFKVTTSGSLTTLAEFNFTNGANPIALTLGSDGNFYGTTGIGGITNSSYPSGYGTVFKLTTNGTLTTLAAFNFTNGAYPQRLTLGSDGNFYGTTAMGGVNSASYPNGNGTIFQITTNGVLATLASFNYTNGSDPVSLTLKNDGNFYGTTDGGGFGYGTIFQITTNGALTMLFEFDYTNGYDPEAITQGGDGNYYGTTWGGGSSENGTIFQLTTNGALSTIYAFNYTNGANPADSLTLGNDGNFYGTTEDGGSNYSGTIFRFVLSSVPPLITAQPQSQTNYAEATVTFVVNANAYNPLYYQWQKNGTNLVDDGNLSGATNNTLTISDISDDDDGVYSVIISNAVGGVTSSNATLTVSDLPFIVTQPLSQAVGIGSGVTLTATALGAPPFVFQWYYNNLPIGQPAAGENVASYVLTNVQTNESGNYSVEVINGYGSAMSSNALLTVEIFPPMIAVQPVNQIVMSGGSASFLASVSGTPPLHYQWYSLQMENSNLIAGISTLYYPGATLGAVVPLSADWWPIASGTLIYGGTPATLVAARQYFNGRVVAFGHDGMIDPTPTANDQQFILNVVQWLNGSGITNIVFSTGHEEDSSVADLQVFLSTNGFNLSSIAAPITSNSLASNSVLIVKNAYLDFTTNEIECVRQFVQNGGGLCLAGLGWSWLSYHTNVMADYPIVQLASPFDITWGQSYVSQPNNLQAFPTLLVGYTNMAMSLNLVTPSDAGNYLLLATNASGYTVSSNAALTVVLSPNSQTNNAGSTATFAVQTFGPILLHYQWQKDGTNMVDGGNIIGSSSNTLTIANVSDNDAVSYTVVVSNSFSSVTTSNAWLTVIDPPIITSQPLSCTNNAGSTVTFTVTASGTSPAYQWFMGSTLISGAVFSTLTLTNVQDTNVAGYTVVLSNAAGSVTSAPPALLTVIDPPFITGEPMNCTNNAGSTATFIVIANGTSPVYQWFKGSSPISGAALATLILTNVQDTNVAGYTVVLKNSAGSATSAPPATLTVIDPPLIATQPLGRRLIMGNPASFSVTVTGTVPFVYQWRFNGISLLYATNSNYSIQAIGTNNSGNYSVVVTNIAGSATSSNALLTVIVPPTLSLQFLAGYPLLDLDGMLSNSYVVQYSTNLVGTNWINLISIPNLSENPYQFLDPAGNKLSERFYRALMQ